MRRRERDLGCALFCLLISVEPALAGTVSALNSRERNVHSERSKPREGNYMSRKTTSWKRRKQAAFIVAKASACTWVVAFSRKLIPGALFKSKDAALAYAATLSRAAGLGSPSVRVLGDA